MSMPAPAAPPSAAWEQRVLDRSLSGARERSAARARRLVDAARELAAESGSSAAFTVAQVAARAGMSLRSFHRQFGGKDDLLLALFEEESRTGAEALDRALAEVPEPLERVRVFVVGLMGFVVTGSGYASLLVREHLQLAERRPAELRIALLPLVDLLDAQMSAAAAAGVIRPIDRHDVVTVFSLILGHVHTAILFTPDADLAHAGERAWAFCSAALGARP
jgi:AcrR family transcriptional regulator